ncbi:ABC transporter permease [Pseudooceanicola sp. CBS1P-1]|uniref:ABC transporter permease n=1 Tax=Pseudooceanicola albus TaxID=2692189 RepID=A0A6L7G9Y8_9RHOB|nr:MULTISPECIES: ABC transporter permease [Pseudooceanicola]MBT9386016.1 ABC transporter permease [Pseudooceanicola endophyticus]MXN19563.1 ABC transporter permease [Pseudooceanicola albus]
MPEAPLLIRRQRVPGWLSALCYAGGLILGLAIAAGLLMALGVPGPSLWDEFIVETFLTSDGLSQTLTAMIPLALVGLGSALAMRVGFWNIGISGQLWMGAVAATWVSLHGIGPGALRLPLMLVLSCLAGAAWVGLPLLLRLKWNVSEVITTLMLGSIAFLWVQHLLFGAWRDTTTGFANSRSFAPEERLPLLGWGHLHAGIWIVLGVTLLGVLVMATSRVGFYARAVGLNPRAARAAGLPVLGTIAGLVLASGALCGLAGAVIVTGTEYRLSQTIGGDYLFSGIVIAFLARSQLLAVLVVAFVLGGFYTTGNVLKMFYGVSEAVVLLTQGIVLLTVLSAQLFSTYRIERRGNA